MFGLRIRSQSLTYGPGIIVEPMENLGWMSVVTASFRAEARVDLMAQETIGSRGSKILKLKRARPGII